MRYHIIILGLIIIVAFGQSNISITNLVRWFDEIGNPRLFLWFGLIVSFPYECMQQAFQRLGSAMKCFITCLVACVYSYKLESKVLYTLLTPILLLVVSFFPLLLYKEKNVYFSLDVCTFHVY